jgi:uncharacterized protein (DUF4415 family)
MRAKSTAIISDLKRLDSLQDADMDMSEIPELDDAFFAQTPVPWPPPSKSAITIRLDDDVLVWFKKAKGGRGYQTRINSALRTFMLVQRRARTHAQANDEEALTRFWTC